MGAIYHSIALLALYGDLLKRLYPSEALTIVYGLAVLILALIVVVIGWGASRVRHLEGRDARLCNVSVLWLISIYVLQCLYTYDVPDAWKHMFYMVIPLSYIVVVQKSFSDFNIGRLAQSFLVLMVPINAVGLIQYFVSPEFMISNVYSETGGIVERNLLTVVGTFNRYPSLFASADRYSAMGLMQFFFALVVMSGQRRFSRWEYAWIAFNFASSFVALGVAGARSRILIVILELGLILGVQLIRILGLTRGAKGRSVEGRRITFAGVFLLTSALSAAYFSTSEEMPIATFLGETWAERDLQIRVREAAEISLIPESVTLFGEGLGTEGEGGRPGEFGVRSIWHESGLIGGLMLLGGFGGLLFVLARRSVRCLLEGSAIEFGIYSLPLTVILMGLVTGLTSAFELSSGILLGCAIAAILRKPMAKSG